MKAAPSTADPEKIGFRRIASIQADERGRISLGKPARSGRRARPANYAGYVNDAGQIILDPVVEIPAREMWLYKNKKALRMLEEGIASARSGKQADRGSFAKYVSESSYPKNPLQKVSARRRPL